MFLSCYEAEVLVLLKTSLVISHAVSQERSNLTPHHSICALDACRQLKTSPPL